MGQHGLELWPHIHRQGRTVFGSERLGSDANGRGRQWSCTRVPNWGNRLAPIWPVRAVFWRYPIVSKLENGPVQVVNLIGLHERVSLDLRTLAARSTAVLKAGDHVIYAAFEPCELSCDGVQYALPYDHVLRIECGPEVAVRSEIGRAVIGSVFNK